MNRMILSVIFLILAILIDVDSILKCVFLVKKNVDNWYVINHNGVCDKRNYY